MENISEDVGGEPILGKDTELGNKDDDVLELTQADEVRDEPVPPPTSFIDLVEAEMLEPEISVPVYESPKFFTEYKDEGVLELTTVEEVRDETPPPTPLVDLVEAEMLEPEISVPVYEPPKFFTEHKDEGVFELTTVEEVRDETPPPTPLADLVEAEMLEPEISVPA
ncbi:MAG: hypothetical protein KKC21_00055, partial [Nitrospinae bacterium]|nr:hypothetical protein [Nitrospinota bacterium]